MPDQSADVSLAALREMDPYAFEHFVAELWSLYGWNAAVSQRAGDMGVDVDARRPGDGRRQSIQVKRYAADNTVGVGDVRQYAALDRQSGVDETVIVTTSSFTRGAREAGEKLDVTLIDGRELLEMVTDAEGGERVARKHLSGDADLRTSRYTASTGPPTDGERPTRWWIGAVLAGVSVTVSLPVTAFVQGAGASQAVSALTFIAMTLGAGLVALVSVRRLEPAVADGTGTPGPVRTLAERRLLAPFLIVVAVGVLAFNWWIEPGREVVEAIVVLGGFGVVGGYPIAAGLLYRRVQDELRANAIAAEVSSVLEATEALSEGGPETAGAARYLRHRSADAPDEVVMAVPGLVAAALDDPGAAPDAAATLANVAEAFPERIDPVEEIAEAFEKTDDVETGMHLAETLGHLARHDPETVESVAGNVVDAFAQGGPDKRNAATPAVRAFAGTYPDLVGQHAGAVVDTATGDRPARPAWFAADTVRRLAGADPGALGDDLGGVTAALAADPDRTGAASLYVALARCALAAGATPAETAPEWAPDPTMRGRLAGHLGVVPDETPDPPLDEKAFDGVKRAVEAGLAAEDDDTRLWAWGLAAAHAGTDPGVLGYDAVIEGLKADSDRERELVGIAVVRAAATDAEAAARFVPKLDAVLERGTQPGVHGEVPEALIDAALRALASVGREDPTEVTSHADDVAAYLDADAERVRVAAVAALAPVADHAPDLLADHLVALRYLAEREEPAGRGATALLERLDA